MKANQPIRRLFSRAVMMLALMVLTTATAWAVNNPVSNLPGGWHVVNEDTELSSEMLPTLTVGNVTSNSAVASWTACDGVTAYTLQLASDGQFTGSSTGSAQTTLNESFEDGIPNTWTKSPSNVSAASGKGGDGDGCVAFKGSGAYLITPLVENPTNLSFMYKRSSNTTAWELDVSYATSEDGPWTSIGTVTDASTTWQTFSEDLNVKGSVYIKFTDNRSSGSHERYIDLVKITGTSAGSGSIIATETVSSTSHTFTGLAPGTTYYARVKGNGDWSEVVSFTTNTSALTYYQNADGKQGEALKTAMCSIIYSRTELGYDDLWTAFKTTDIRSDGKIWDMYSNITNYTPVTSGSTYSQEGDCYNREHSWPQSWFGGNVMPMYTDLHHIYPTDGFVNGKRANYPFGETNGEDYKSANDFSKLGACTYPDYTGTVFEPADEYKGDFARTYFYMVTCYEEKLADWYTNYGSTDVVNVIDGSTYPGFQTWQLEMLMKWAKDDPVSEKETSRNNAVYAIQNNRNPFIDYPGLEEYIWGNMTTTAFSYDNYVQPANAVTVPTLAIDNITSNGADASWTACDGVSSYTLQLASDDQFTSGGSDSKVTLFSNDANDPSDAPSDWTYNIKNTSGSYLQLMSGNYVVTEAFDASACTALSLSLYMRTYGGTTYPSVTVQYSTDGGTTWSESLGTLSAANTTMAQRTLDVSDASGASSVRLRIASTSTSTSVGVGIQSIVLTGTESASGSIIATETVNGTSHTFSGLDPETTYYARVKGNGDWSNVEEFITVTTSAPVLTVPQEVYTVPVGAPDISFTVTATGTPAPTVTATCTEGAYFLFENNEFRFDPDTEGTYHFVFTATNSEGSDSETVTIVVSAAPVTVPELTVDNVTSNSADASWTACDGVTEYTLQLASDDEFTESSTGGTVTLLTEGFTNATGSSTAVISDFDAITDNAGWEGSYVYREDRTVRISSSKNTGDIESPWLTTATAWTTVTLKFDAKSWTNDQTTVKVTVTEDGATYSDPISFTLTEDMDHYNTNFTVYGTRFRVRFAPSAANKRFYLDNVIISFNSEPVEGSIIATETVSETSHTFTGLVPGTTYYARVKGNRDWSDVVEFRTNNATLSLAENNDNSEAIEAAATSGGKYDVTLAGRTLYKDGHWNTLCLPFSMTAEQVTAQLAPTGLKELDTSATGYDHVTGLDNGTLYLNFKDADAISAGVPYIIMWTSGSSIENPVFSGVTIPDTYTDDDAIAEALDNAAVTFTGGKFTGSYSYTEYLEENRSVLFLGDSNTLYYPEANASIGAFRAYFQLADGITAGDPQNGVRAFVLNFGDGEVQGIRSLTPDPSPKGEGSIYTLDGVKLDEVPTLKGVYIQNGRKVVIK